MVVLTLALYNVGMDCPLDSAQERSAVMPKSRIATKITKYQGISGTTSGRVKNVPSTKTLSANGSINCPNRDLAFQRRAKRPSSQSDKPAMMNNKAAIRRGVVWGMTSSHKKMGVITIRVRLITLGSVLVTVLQVEECNRGCGEWASVGS